MLSREGTSRRAGSRGVVLRLLTPQPTTPKAVNNIIFKWEAIAKRIPKNYYFNKHFKPCSLKMMSI